MRQHNKGRILVVDDDVYIGDMVEEMLTKEGYTVMRAYSGTEAALLLESANRADSLTLRGSGGDGRTGESKLPDLILLDLMLPGLSGEDLLAKVRGIPVIVVSAKSGIDDKVELLLGGAADYITKPFEGRELLARIAVQLRQKSEEQGAALQENRAGEETLWFAEISLSPSTHMVMVGEQPVRLTKTEFAILKILMRNPKQVITKSVLLDRISDESPDCVENSLKVHISNLRKKLREASSDNSDYIEAVWGIGFKMKTM